MGTSTSRETEHTENILIRILYKRSLDLAPFMGLFLEGRTPKEKHPFHFRRNLSRAKPKCKEHFSLGLPSGARQWRGFRGAYGLI